MMLAVTSAPLKRSPSISDISLARTALVCPQDELLFKSNIFIIYTFIIFGVIIATTAYELYPVANTSVVALDSNHVSSVTGEQTVWLNRSLANGTLHFIIILFDIQYIYLCSFIAILPSL